MQDTEKVWSKTTPPSNARMTMAKLKASLPHPAFSDNSTLQTAVSQLAVWTGRLQAGNPSRAEGSQIPHHDWTVREDGPNP